MTGEDVTKVVGEVDVNEVKNEIARDRHLVVEVDRAASRALRSTFTAEFTSDITGEPWRALEFNRWKQDEIRGLEAVTRETFFARINALVTDRNGKEQLVLLVSRVRGVSGSLEGEGWELMSWTSPLSRLLIDKAIGYTAEYRAAPDRPKISFDVGVSGKFEALLPRIENAHYRLESGNVFIESELAFEHALQEAEEQQCAVALSSDAPSIEYKAVETFGLGDIIVLADDPQREAMLLPFLSHVLVEGPPGSGKTSIGIMRIACLIDQQWEELGLTKGRDQPFHRASSMKVLVFGREMVGYLTTLVRSIGIEDIPVQATSQFLRQVCREAKTLSGREAPDRPAYLAQVKGRREVLPAYWAGFRAHVSGLWVNARDKLEKEISAITPELSQCTRIIDAWVGRVQTAKFRGVELTVPVNLAESLTRWADTRRPSLEDVDSTNQGMKAVRTILREFLRRALVVPA